MESLFQEVLRKRKACFESELHSEFLKDFKRGGGVSTHLSEQTCFSMDFKFIKQFILFIKKRMKMSDQASILKSK